MRRIFCALAFAAAACTNEGGAQLLVVVSSDLSVRDELDAIHIRLRDTSGAMTDERSVPIDSLPVSFGVAPEGDDATRPADIEIAAVLAGDERFRTRVKTGFIANKRLRLDIFLAESCLAAACGSTQACFGGFCTGAVEIPVETLPETGGDASVIDASIPDTGPTEDAGDAGSSPDTGERCTTGADLFFEAVPMNRLLGFPSVAWNGSEFAVAWVDFDVTTQRGELAFARIAADASMRLDRGWVRINTTLTGTTASPEYSQLRWTGSDWAALWSDVRPVNDAGRLFFARLDAASNTANMLSMIVDKPMGYIDLPGFAFDGTNFGVSWREDYAFGRFTLMTPDGMPMGSIVDLRDGAYTRPLFVEPQREWAIGVSHYISPTDYEIYLHRLLDDGHTFADLDPPEFPGSNFPSQFLSLEWSGTEYGIAWLEGHNATPETYDVVFTTLGADAAPKMPFVLQASPANIQYPPVLSYTASLGFGLFWWDDYFIHFARLGSDGSKRTELPRVNTGDNALSGPAVAPAGDAFGVVWLESDGLHFTTVQCAQ